MIDKAKLCGTSMLALGLAAICTPVSAQEALEEIIVTAQKREESAQTTAISMAVLNEAEIDRRGVTNVGDLATLVPNMRVSPFGGSPTTLRVFIRGLGPSDSQVTQDPPVGTYLNGVYIARPVGLTLDIPDIERVEVLRGPQGTLYGRNTTGGAINVITKRPGDKFGVSQLLSYGNYDAIRSQTRVNVPVTDNFFVAAAFSLNKRDGWQENTGPGKDFSAIDGTSGRLDARWLPTDKITLDYSYDTAENTYTADYYHLTVPSGPGALVPGLPAQPGRLKRAGLAAPFEEGGDKVYGHTLTVSAETPLGEVRAISGYRKIRAHAYQDFSANPGVTIYRTTRSTVNQWQFSQELQLLGETASKKFEYIAGVYYFRENANETGNGQFFTFPIVTGVKARNESRAIYGQATVRPDADSRWSLTAGLRYTEDDRWGNNIALVEAERKDSKVTGSLSLDYQAADNTFLYAKVVQGYKAGGFNMRQAAFDQGFAPETLLSYETGVKSELFDRRLRVNVAGFYMDYKDIQLDIVVPNQPDPTLTRTTNAGKATIMGIEAEVAVLLTDNLRASLNYGLNYSDIKKVEGDDADLYRLPFASKHSLSGGIVWDVLKTDAGVLNFSTDTTFRTDFVSNARELPDRVIPGYTITDARLAFEGQDWIGQGTNFTIAGWVRNVFDKEYAKDSFSSFGGLHANRVTTYGLPRTYGIELRVAY